MFVLRCQCTVICVFMLLCMSVVFLQCIQKNWSGSEIWLFLRFFVVRILKNRRSKNFERTVCSMLLVLIIVKSMFKVRSQSSTVLYRCRIILRVACLFCPVCSVFICLTPNSMFNVQPDCRLQKPIFKIHSTSTSSLASMLRE